MENADQRLHANGARHVNFYIITGIRALKTTKQKKTKNSKKKTKQNKTKIAKKKTKKHPRTHDCIWSIEISVFEGTFSKACNHNGHEKARASANAQKMRK